MPKKQTEEINRVKMTFRKQFRASTVKERKPISERKTVIGRLIPGHVTFRGIPVQQPGGKEHHIVSEVIIYTI